MINLWQKLFFEFLVGGIGHVYEECQGYYVEIKRYFEKNEVPQIVRRRRPYTGRESVS